MMRREKHNFLCQKDTGMFQNWQGVPPWSFSWLSYLRLWVKNWEHHDDHSHGAARFGWKPRKLKFFLCLYCSLGIWLSFMYLSDPGTDFKFAAVLLSDFGFLSKSCLMFHLAWWQHNHKGKLPGLLPKHFTKTISFIICYMMGQRYQLDRVQFKSALKCVLKGPGSIMKHF